MLLLLHHYIMFFFFQKSRSSGYSKHDIILGIIIYGYHCTLKSSYMDPLHFCIVPSLFYLVFVLYFYFLHFCSGINLFSIICLHLITTNYSVFQFKFQFLNKPRDVILPCGSIQGYNDLSADLSTDLYALTLVEHHTPIFFQLHTPSTSWAQSRFLRIASLFINKLISDYQAVNIK